MSFDVDNDIVMYNYIWWTDCGYRAVRTQWRFESVAVDGQSIGDGLLGRRQRQRSAVHKRHVHGPTAGECHGRCPRDNRRSRRPGHRIFWQCPVHGHFRLQKLFVGAGLADRRRHGVQ